MVSGIIRPLHNYSTYHFSRLFKTLVGETPKEYLRKRRLTIAAKRLLTEEIRILELAMDCQFDSQEAFTRAFKAQFNMTPAQYRKHADPLRLLYKDQFSPNELNYLQHELSMTPQIITQPATKLVGIAARYDNTNLNLPTLWSAFQPYRDKIKHRLGNQFFGIYEGYEEHGNDDASFIYICSAPVSHFADIPQNMITRDLPEQLYARFTHRGPIAHLEQTLKYIWGSWLPKSSYEYIEKPDFELYGAGFNPADPNSELYLHVPIQPRNNHT